MTVLVDPPPRGRPGKGSASTAKTQRQPTVSPGQAAPPEATAPEDIAPEGTVLEGTIRLAEPPITGGSVEALMGRLIKVLAHSPLARPLPAVTLSALGLLGVAFAGLCAAAPHPSVATPPVLLPLTDLAHKLGAPHLSSGTSNLLMYVSITLCCLGLAMMLWANSHLGWAPSPRKVFAVAAGTIAVLVNITPVGSADIASYAAYGRIAALGQNPYVFTPHQLPGINQNPYTAIINPMWRNTPSVYGPIATWVQTLAAQIGGPRAWVTIWVLMMMMALAFLATGYVLIRTADNPVRAALMWVANPLLIVELVMGGHLDTLLALTAICAIVLSRRTKSLRGDLLVGLFVGASGAIKINAVYVALAIAIPLLHDRDWKRLLRTMAVAGATVAALYYFSWGFVALKPLRSASQMVISPTIWRLLQVWAQQINPHSVPMVTTVIGLSWEPIMLGIAWYLYNRLSPDVPTVVAATCALTFAWAIAESWSLPWYTAIAWVTLALLPRNSLTRWLTLATGALALVHFNGGWPQNMTTGPTP
jgi:Dolichyl-phosphate-mannose-protein mannosyltransferase